MSIEDSAQIIADELGCISVSRISGALRARPVRNSLVSSVLISRIVAFAYFFKLFDRFLDTNFASPELSTGFSLFDDLVTDEVLTPFSHKLEKQIRSIFRRK